MRIRLEAALGVVMLLALTAASVAQSSCPSTLPVDPYTEGKWGFNGNLADASGNLQDGVLGGSPLPAFNYTLYASPTASLLFENAGTEDSDGYMEVPSCPPWGTPTALTIEAWIRPTSGSGDDLRREILVRSSESAGTGQFPFGLRLNALNQLEGWVNNVGTAATFCQSTTPLPLDAWSYVAMTYDGVDIKVYVDGSEAGTAAAAGSIQNLTGNFIIGAQKNVPNPNPRGPFGHSFKGYIDEVRVSSIVRVPTCDASTCQFTPPRLLTPALAAGFAQNESITHTWEAVQGASYYLVDFASSRASQFDNCVWDYPRVVTGTTATYSHQDVHDPIHWRVRAVLATGDTTNASIGYYFVGTATPSLAVPHIQSAWGTQNAVNAAVLHSWSAVPGATLYEIQFANARPNTLNLLDDCDWDPIRVVTDTIATYDHQSTHCPIYWRIRAGNALEQRSNWAGSYYYVGDCGECAPPCPDSLTCLDLAPPRLFEPALGAVFAPGQQILHRWLPLGNVAYYLVDFASNRDGQFASCTFDAPRTVLWGPYITLNHDDTHEPIVWRVRGVTTCGDTTNAAVGYYFVRAADTSCGDLAAPHLVSPALGSQFAQNVPIQHTWNCVPNADHYLLDFASSRASQFTNCDWDLPRVVNDTTAIATHEDIHEPLHWRVRAVLVSGDTTNAAFGSYFVGTGTAPLRAPVISGPWGSEEVVNASILHSWQAVAGAVSYEIQFANARPHTLNLIDDCDWDAIRTVVGTSAYYDHQSQHCPIYWRIRAVDAGGGRSSWSGAYYYVGGSAPACDGAPASALGVPTILGPWAVVKAINATVHHEWTAVDGATGYEVQFANAAPNTLSLFANCDWDLPRFVTDPWLDTDHQSAHCPIYFRVRAIDGVGAGEWAVSYYKVESPTSVEPPDGSDPIAGPVPIPFVLHPNSPNPFNPSTVIRFDLLQSMPVNLAVYDAAGRLVRNLVRGIMPAGTHRVVWDGRNDAGTQMPSGVYYSRLQSAKGSQAQSMVMIK